MRQNHCTMKYISQWPTFILRSSTKSYWLIIPRYYVYTSNSLQDIRQNHWTMKYRSQWPTFILRSSISHTDLLAHGIMFTHQITKIKGKITEPWNIGHSDPLLFWDQAWSHPDSLPQGIMFKHQIVFKILGKIPEPWNIGQSDSLLFSTLISVCDLDLGLAAEWCQLFCNHTEVTLIKHQQPR